MDCGRDSRTRLEKFARAQGSGFDPMYVDPNGRYAPTGNDHDAGYMTGGVLGEARCSHVYSDQVMFNGGSVTNSVNCANWSATDMVFENNFRIAEGGKLGLGKGLVFLNLKGKVAMFLDEDGSFEISGELKETSRLKKTNNRDEGLIST